ncbi:MAG: GAF and ANTAR domain-containing protein [Acidimicrobiales bacterium]
MLERSTVVTGHSWAKRAAWSFGSAKTELVESQRSGHSDPVDVEGAIARFRELGPGDQRAVVAFINAYHHLSGALVGVTGDQEDATVAETFAQVARLLMAEEGLERTLSKISELAVQTIDGCDHAGISLVQGGKVTTAGASDEVPVQVDTIQYEANQGPCLDAIWHHAVFRCDCLADEERWPEFSKRASEETGVASMLAFRLFAEEDTMGALNLFSKEPGAFGDDAQEIGAVFATHAAVALSSALKEEQLHQAIGSRDMIGQAKGILMARQGMTGDQAFDVLRSASQRLNLKLREVADRLVASTDEAAGPAPAGASPAAAQPPGRPDRATGGR